MRRILNIDQFRINFPELPHYLEVVGTLIDSRTMRGAPLHKSISITVYSSIHVNKEWQIPTTFSLDYCHSSDRWKDKILSLIINHYNLKFEGSYL